MSFIEMHPIVALCRRSIVCLCLHYSE